MTNVTINTLLVAILCIASLCSCDHFRVNICQANPDYESCINPMGSSDPAEANRFDMSTRTSASDLANPTNSAKFMSIGNIDLAPAGYQQKFAGSLSGGRIMFMRNTHNTPIEYRLALNIFTEQPPCTKCPLINGELYWSNDTVYTANDIIIQVRKKNGNIYLSDSVCVWKASETFSRTCYNDTLLTVRPAISFIGNGFSYGLEAGTGDDYSAKIILDGSFTIKSYDRRFTPTFLALGEFYPTRTNRLTMLLYFNQDMLLLVDSSPPSDTIPLRDALQQAMKSTTGPILGAEVIDINADGNAELVYLRSKAVYSLTVSDSVNQTSPTISHWRNPLIDLNSLPSGEEIKALRAVDINGDSRPDLAIETDKRVLFYLNQAQ